MARLVAAKCPNCGGGVHIPPAVEWVTCRFCQVSSFIERAKTPDPARSPPPSGAPVIHVPEAKSFKWWLLAGVLLLGLGIAVVTQHELTTLDNVAFIGVPMLFDVNADGAPDAVVPALIAGSGQVHLRAQDALTGETLWRTDDLEKVGETLFALASDTALFFRGGKVRGFDARTGKARFEQALPEKVSTVCEHRGRSFLLLADKKLYAIDPSTGALNATPTEGVLDGADLEPDCAPAWSTEYSIRGRLIRTTSHLEGLDVEGMRVSTVARFGDGEQVSLAVGVRSTGTSIPMVAGVREKTALWKADLPAVNPLGAKTGEPEAFTVAAGRAYTTHERTEEPGFTLTSFSLANGTRNWETQIRRERDPSTIKLVASEKHVFAYASGLYGFSASDGRLLWSAGWGLEH